MKLPPEFAYVDEPDEAQAQKLLEPLLRKYPASRDCDRLLKVLRTGRPYPSKTPSQVTLDHVCSDGKTRQFTVVVPDKYTARKPSPVVLFLHGAVRQPAPGGGANEARLFGPAFDRLDAIVVGPSTYEGVEWSDPACRGLVRHALDFVKRRLNVDEDRVWVAGDSDGARGAFAMAETEATFLAAGVPVIGSPGRVTRFANLRNLPWLQVNGDKDTLFKIEGVRETAEHMQATGIDLTFRVVEGAGHDPYLVVKQKDVVTEFLAAHPRDPFPAVVEWERDLAAEGSEARFPADTFRWVRIDEVSATAPAGDFGSEPARLLDPGLARVRASREGNVFRLTTRKVSVVTVLLSRDMVDLAQPVEVHVNGALAYRRRAETAPRVVLEEARRFNDRVLLFEARVRVEVGAAPVTDDAADED